VRGFAPNILSEDAGVGAHDLVGVPGVSMDAEHGFGATCSRPVGGVGHLEVLSVALGAKIILRRISIGGECSYYFCHQIDKLRDLARGERLLRTAMQGTPAPGGRQGRDEWQ